MTPAEHIQAIEDAAGRYAKACHENPELDARMLEICGASWALLRAAIRAAVGAAPDSNLPTYTEDLELRYVEACEERDHLRQLLPREGWQLVPVEPIHAMLAAAAITRPEYRSLLEAAPKP